MMAAVSSIWIYLLVTEPLAYERCDGHVGKTEIVRDARETATQDVRRHIRQR